MSTNAEGCCGPVKDRVDLIKQVSKGLRDGHHGIAALYESLAADSPEQEREAFRAIAIEHRRMGDESLNVVVPDAYVEEEEESA